jgi:ubiquitin-conjugating enzyme E2 I
VSNVECACKGSALGCDWEGPRGSCTEHEAKCLYAHLREERDARVEAAAIQASMLEKVEDLEVKLTRRLDEMDTKHEYERRTIRVAEERREWQKAPLPGFVMRWVTINHGFLRSMTTDRKLCDANTPQLVCGVPGPVGSSWEGGIFPVTMVFPLEYPMLPPKVQLPKGFFHVNVYPSGTMSQSVLIKDEDWTPSITVKEILRICQRSLIDPNPNSPAQAPAYHMYIGDAAAYDAKSREQAAHYTAETVSKLAEEVKLLLLPIHAGQVHYPCSLNDPVEELVISESTPTGVFDDGDRAVVSIGG